MIRYLVHDKLRICVLVAELTSGVLMLEREPPSTTLLLVDVWFVISLSADLKFIVFIFVYMFNSVLIFIFISLLCVYV